MKQITNKLAIIFLVVILITTAITTFTFFKYESKTNDVNFEDDEIELAAEEEREKTVSKPKHTSVVISI